MITLIIVIDKGKGFDASQVAIPKIESKINFDEKKEDGAHAIKELIFY